MKLVGLSLSMCIRDLLTAPSNMIGKMNQISKIITNTKCETDEHWKTTLDRYCQNYWYDWPELALTIVSLLQREGLIIQPRLGDDHYGHSTCEGHWMLADPEPVLKPDTSAAVGLSYRGVYYDYISQTQRVF